MRTMWYAGVCDNLLMTLSRWEAKYESGNVFADRQFLTKTGEVIPVPVKYVNRVIVSRSELEYLHRILSERAPKSALIADIAHILKRFDRNPLLPSTHAGPPRRVLQLAFYKADVSLMRQIVQKEKEGGGDNGMDIKPGEDGKLWV